MADDEEKSQMPPPPPEGGEEAYQEEGYIPEAQDYAEDGVQSGGPAVANAATKNMVVMLLGGALFLFLIYQLFFSGSETVPVPQNVGVPAETGGAAIAPIQDIPEIVEPIAPPPLPPPPPIEEEDPITLPPPPPVDPDIDFDRANPANEQLQQRRASEMLIVNSGASKDVQAGGRQNESNTVEVTTEAQRAVATQVGDLYSLVLQGKVIHATLETAIDTTLPGPLRAIVSRDVYAEAGDEVLIPKGSRLIGTYNTDIVRGQGRVFIIWNRVIRPDGIDVEIGSQAIDNLGRSGITGYVDDRYFEIFGGAVLTSILGIAVAGVADAILDPEATSTTTNSDGSSTTTGSSVDQSIGEAVDTIGTVSKSVVGGFLDIRPSITVDQGTPVKVFVNRDLEFPPQLTNRVRIIQ